MFHDNLVINEQFCFGISPFSNKKQRMQNNAMLLYLKQYNASFLFLSWAVGLMAYRH